MNVKTRNILSIFMIIVGIIAIITSILIENLVLLLAGGIMLVVSVLFLVFSMSFDVFRRDKILDIDSLKKQGLTIVRCPECEKNNVLEDKYCIFCGEELKNEDK